MTFLHHSKPTGFGHGGRYPQCSECVKMSAVWVQCVVDEWDRDHGYFCSVECMKVWAIKQRLTRDEIK